MGTGSSPITSPRFRFAEYEVDVRAGELLRGGRRIRLAPKPFEVLLALLERPDEVVLREELRARLWPDNTVVDFDNNLNSAVATLRETLGDAASSPRYFETLPKRGYRFLLPVEIRAPEPPPAPAATGAARRRAGGIAVIVGASALVAVALATLSGAPNRPGAEPLSGAAKEAFEKGRYLLDSPRNDADAARAELTRAVALAPEFAPARAQLARALRLLPQPPRETVPMARAELARALELDPELPDTHLELAMIALYFDYDWAMARSELLRAGAGSATSSLVEQAYASYLAAMGRFDEALEAMQRARELDPVAVSVAADAGWYAYVARRPEQALELTAEALELAPNSTSALFYRLLAFNALGNRAGAVTAAARYARASGEPAEVAAHFETDVNGLRDFHRWRLERRQRRAAGEYVSPSDVALDHLALGEHDAALSELERAYEERSGWLLPFLRVYPLLDPLRQQERFRALEKKLDFPEAVP